MPTCPVCGNKVSLLHWPLFGGACAACAGLDLDVVAELLARPCPECGSDHTFATTAPALAVVSTKYGVVPSKCGPGLHILGCADCGHAWFRFDAAGAAALASSPGWISQRQLKRLGGKSTFECPRCGNQIDLQEPTGVRVSDDEPRRLFCDHCNAELSPGSA